MGHHPLDFLVRHEGSPDHVMMRATGDDAKDFGVSFFLLGGDGDARIPDLVLPGGRPELLVPLLLLGGDGNGHVPLKLQRASDSFADLDKDNYLIAFAPSVGLVERERLWHELPLRLRYRYIHAGNIRNHAGRKRKRVRFRVGTSAASDGVVQVPTRTTKRKGGKGAKAKASTQRGAGAGAGAGRAPFTARGTVAGVGTSAASDGMAPLPTQTTKRKGGKGGKAEASTQRGAGAGAGAGRAPFTARGTVAGGGARQQPKGSIHYRRVKIKTEGESEKAVRSQAHAQAACRNAELRTRLEGLPAAAAQKIVLSQFTGMADASGVVAKLIDLRYTLFLGKDEKQPFHLERSAKARAMWDDAPSKGRRLTSAQRFAECPEVAPTERVRVDTMLSTSNPVCVPNKHLCVTVAQDGALSGQLQTVFTCDLPRGTLLAWSGRLAEESSTLSAYALTFEHNGTTMELEPDLRMAGSYVNDYRGPDRTKRHKLECAHFHNLDFTVVRDTYGRPYVFMITTRAVSLDEVACLDYGDAYWKYYDKSVNALSYQSELCVAVSAILACTRGCSLRNPIHVDEGPVAATRLEVEVMRTVPVPSATEQTRRRVRVRKRRATVERLERERRAESSQPITTVQHRNATNDPITGNQLRRGGGSPYTQTANDPWMKRSTEICGDGPALNNLGGVVTHADDADDGHACDAHDPQLNVLGDVCTACACRTQENAYARLVHGDGPWSCPSWTKIAALRGTRPLDLDNYPTTAWGAENPFAALLFARARVVALRDARADNVGNTLHVHSMLVTANSAGYARAYDLTAGAAPSTGGRRGRPPKKKKRSSESVEFKYTQRYAGMMTHMVTSGALATQQLQQLLSEPVAVVTPTELITGRSASSAARNFWKDVSDTAPSADPRHTAVAVLFHAGDDNGTSIAYSHLIAVLVGWELGVVLLEPHSPAQTPITLSCSGKSMQRHVMGCACIGGGQFGTCATGATSDRPSVLAFAKTLLIGLRALKDAATVAAQPLPAALLPCRVVAVLRGNQATDTLCCLRLVAMLLSVLPLLRSTRQPFLLTLDAVAKRAGLSRACVMGLVARGGGGSTFRFRMQKGRRAWDHTWGSDAPGVLAACNRNAALPTTAAAGPTLLDKVEKALAGDSTAQLHGLRNVMTRLSRRLSSYTGAPLGGSPATEASVAAAALLATVATRLGALAVHTVIVEIVPRPARVVASADGGGEGCAGGAPARGADGNNDGSSVLSWPAGPDDTKHVQHLQQQRFGPRFLGFTQLSTHTGLSDFTRDRAFVQGISVGGVGLLFVHTTWVSGKVCAVQFACRVG